jgi:glycosyltransferase involved in cell wall biosynthesis
MQPTVSVVVSVYNGETYLERSLHSVLAQERVSLELIVVDDGSTDGSARVLEKLAQADARVRVLHQENQGLTRALIRGCREARGEFIARHDADDLSLPGRLALQIELLRSSATLSMVSCCARALGPRDEELFTVVRPTDSQSATDALRRGEQGPCGHGSVLFPTQAYHLVGGYREEFRYAQDWDLWLRLTEVGQIAYVPELLYCYRLSESSISAHRRGQQLRLKQLAHACQQARSSGGPEQRFLKEAVRVCSEPVNSSGNNRAGNSYFIGKCLLDRRDRRALGYLKRCVRQAPWNWRHWAALAGAALLCRSNPS